ncbi:hypothetical protein B5802_10195, partial [Gilliamella apicola]
MENFWELLDKKKINYYFENNKIIINSNLNLKKKIKVLPDNLFINGDLNLSETKIQKIPENLVVTGSLNLSFSDIQVLPDNFLIGGDLDLAGSKIKI